MVRVVEGGCVASVARERWAGLRGVEGEEEREDGCCSGVLAEEGESDDCEEVSCLGVLAAVSSLEDEEVLLA